MALVIIQAPALSAAAKKRIGDQVITALHNEDVHASSVVVLFRAEDSDVYLDGGLLFEGAAKGAQAPAPASAAAPAAPAAPAPAPAPAPARATSPDFKTKARRSKTELADLKAQLIKKLQLEGALSSFQAQEALGLKDCAWAPATLRRFFSELEAEGAVTKQGQKRGTRYVWVGVAHMPTSAPAVPKLVKKQDSEG
jgi:pyruvate/2-oxoglutarate dehydrogenase complex dihydrolipoamide acyltransferase (E2) component